MPTFGVSQMNLATQYWASMGFSAQQIAMNKAIMFSPEGHAGFVLSSVGFFSPPSLLAFSVAGGAAGVRVSSAPPPQNRAIKESSNRRRSTKGFAIGPV